MINLITIISKINILFNNVESIEYWNLLVRNFDGLRIDINIDTNQTYLNNLMIKVATTT